MNNPYSLFVKNNQLHLIENEKAPPSPQGLASSKNFGGKKIYSIQAHQNKFLHIIQKWISGRAEESIEFKHREKKFYIDKKQIIQSLIIDDKPGKKEKKEGNESHPNVSLLVSQLFKFESGNKVIQSQDYLEVFYTIRLLKSHPLFKLSTEEVLKLLLEDNKQIKDLITQIKNRDTFGILTCLLNLNEQEKPNILPIINKIKSPFSINLKLFKTPSNSSNTENERAFFSFKKDVKPSNLEEYLHLISKESPFVTEYNLEKTKEILSRKNQLEQLSLIHLSSKEASHLLSLSYTIKGQNEQNENIPLKVLISSLLSFDFSPFIRNDGEFDRSLFKDLENIQEASKEILQSIETSQKKLIENNKRDAKSLVASKMYAPQLTYEEAYQIIAQQLYFNSYKSVDIDRQSPIFTHPSFQAMKSRDDAIKLSSSWNTLMSAIKGDIYFKGPDSFERFFSFLDSPGFENTKPGLSGLRKRLREPLTTFKNILSLQPFLKSLSKESVYSFLKLQHELKCVIHEIPSDSSDGKDREELLSSLNSFIVDLETQNIAKLKEKVENLTLCIHAARNQAFKNKNTVSCSFPESFLETSNDILSLLENMSKDLAASPDNSMPSKSLIDSSIFSQNLSKAKAWKLLYIEQQLLSWRTNPKEAILFFEKYPDLAKSMYHLDHIQAQWDHLLQSIKENNFHAFTDIHHSCLTICFAKV